MAAAKHGIAADLPVGYRFAPTDELLVTHYLMNKVFCRPLPAHVADDIDAIEFYMTISGEEREWFFFINQDENCEKPIRIVGNEIGFWKSSGEENPIHNSDGNVFAFKTFLTYFRGKLPKAKKTHWGMEEYRVHVDNIAQDLKIEKWVLARIRRGKDYNSYP